MDTLRVLLCEGPTLQKETRNILRAPRCWPSFEQSRGDLLHPPPSYTLLHSHPSFSTLLPSPPSLLPTVLPSPSLSFTLAGFYSNSSINGRDTALELPGKAKVPNRCVPKEQPGRGLRLRRGIRPALLRWCTVCHAFIFPSLSLILPPAILFHSPSPPSAVHGTIRTPSPSFSFVSPPSPSLSSFTFHFQQHQSRWLNPVGLGGVTICNRIARSHLAPSQYGVTVSNSLALTHPTLSLEWVG